jgi:FAD/FMN-containing dehydrogenase
VIIEDDLKNIISKELIRQDPAILNEFSRDISFVQPIKPSAIVKPQNTAEVESLVKYAIRTRTPLVPISSGPPHFRGDTVPGTGGAIIADLSGMKKIIRVDRENRVAMVEPGVTFGELIPAVKQAGLRLNMPFLPRQSKSVVGSLLEKEPVTMPVYHWDMADPLNCVEIVFGTGENYRTGSAAGPGTIEQQWAAKQAQTDAAGPSQASFHTLIQGAQGTLGIVTWASLRCEISPKIQEPFLMGSANLGKILEMVHWLVRLRLADECLILNNTSLAAIFTRKWPEDYATIKNTLPRWILFFNITGFDYLPEKRVAYRIQDMSDRAQNIGLEATKVLSKVNAAELLGLTQNPSPEPFWKLRYKGAVQDIFFLSTLERIPSIVTTMNNLADQAGYAVPDVGVYIQPVAQATSYHCEFNLFYDPQNSSEVDKIKQLSTEAEKKLMKAGAFFSRPYGDNARLIFNQDSSLVEALKKVKAIFDPENIMNPGKLCF